MTDLHNKTPIRTLCCAQLETQGLLYVDLSLSLHDFGLCDPDADKSTLLYLLLSSCRHLHRSPLLYDLLLARRQGRPKEG